jgi:molecular chaperone DnaK (HSP70)
MSIWNKVLVGLICVASLAFFYMAARTLKTHQHWRELAIKCEKRLVQVQADNERLMEGDNNQTDPSQMGIRQRRIALRRLLLDRGRVWTKCDPKVKLNAQDGAASVAIAVDQTEPHGIPRNSILYAFEQADVQNKGRFMGEFKVTESDDKKTLTLVPTLPLSPPQVECLSTAKRPWELYEILPRDNHEVFAGLSDKEKEALLGGNPSFAEYRDDGAPATKDMPADCVVDGKYVRRLRDYRVQSAVQNMYRTLLTDKIDATARDLKLIEESLAQAKEQDEAAKQDVAAATEEAKEFSRQRDAVAAYLKSVEKELDAAQADIEKRLKDNREMAENMAKLQLEAARAIDERTRSMAQSGAGGT